MRSLESIIKANKEVEPGYHAEKLPDYYAEKVERLKKMYGDGLHENAPTEVLLTNLRNSLKELSEVCKEKLAELDEPLNPLDAERCTYCGADSKSFRLCDDPLCIHNE